MKGKRQEKILEIIRTNDIETQEELTKKLSEAGFSSTQGTISRDIRELKLTKVTGANGKQKYAPIQTEDIHVSSKLSDFICNFLSQPRIRRDRRSIFIYKRCMKPRLSVDTIDADVSVFNSDDCIFCSFKYTISI